jgi:hypothetical protein
MDWICLSEIFRPRGGARAGRAGTGGSAREQPRTGMTQNGPIARNGFNRGFGPEREETQANLFGTRPYIYIYIYKIYIYIYIYYIYDVMRPSARPQIGFGGTSLNSWKSNDGA